jgi:hypothetical protein
MGPRELAVEGQHEQFKAVQLELKDIAGEQLLDCHCNEPFVRNPHVCPPLRHPLDLSNWTAALARHWQFTGGASILRPPKR